ncbi:MAG: GDP-mannose 4,6-dehydratase [Methanoregula sp.]|nr:GDP-mannose 4,6-dehydratase [Methanoregula sp.]
MRLLVTGASGFTGMTLIRFLLPDKDIQITGITRGPNPRSFTETGVTWVTADLLDRDGLGEIVSSARPDAVIHLAGLNQGSPADLITTNICGTHNILEATTRVNPECRILVTSSSAVYGYQGASPITETNPIQPLTEYGAAKAGMEMFAQVHHRARGCHVAISRPFNLAGPGQTGVFLCGKIVRQIVEIGRGKRDAIDLFETQSSRDFIDVRDVVRAYTALISHPRFNEECAGNVFNIGSGRPCGISEVITILEKITGKTYPVRLPEVPQRISIPSQQSDNTRIKRLTGWTPQITMEKTLRDMLAAEMSGTPG